MNFKVGGNCEMCKDRIETAAKKVPGVEKADWDTDSKMIKVTFDKDQTSLDDIQRAIANAGHDTEKYRAEAMVYDGLPGCCQYDRPAAIGPEEDHEMHKH